MDDGPVDIEECLDMARQAVADGIERVVATPHSQNGSYVNTRGDICRRVREINLLLESAAIDLVVLPGAEEHIRPELGHAGMPDMVCTINETGRYVLVEFPVMSVPRGVREVFFRMKQQGLTPVLAHPERNAAIQENIEILYAFVETSCVTQITAMSLTGELGESARGCACRMVALRLAHVIASDAHSAGHRRPELSSAVAVAAQLMGSRKEAENMVVRTPRAIISGNSALLRQPARPRIKKRWLFGG
jgi:protein-tyrosine phosphatase